LTTHHGSPECRHRRSRSREWPEPQSRNSLKVGGRRLEGSTVDDLGRGLDVPPAFECAGIDLSTDLPLGGRDAVESSSRWHDTGATNDGTMPDRLRFQPGPFAAVPG
jgi:hypothetical protein